MNIPVRQHIHEDEYILDPWRAQGTIKLMRLVEKDL